MDDSNEPEVKAVPEKQKNKKVRIIYIILAIILAATLVAGGWFYYDLNRIIRDRNAHISNLQNQLRDLGVEPAGDEEKRGAAATCYGGSAYTAEVGRFNLTLSNPNVIIRSLDGNFEGGPVTQLSVGRCVEGATNVADVYPLSEVKILAHPSSDAATLRANFEAQWGSPLTAGSNVTINGVTAETHTGEGLFSAKLLYFDYGGIGYQIELTDTNDTSESILTDVIADWSFTP